MTGDLVQTPIYHLDVWFAYSNKSIILSACLLLFIFLTVSWYRVLYAQSCQCLWIVH